MVKWFRGEIVMNNYNLQKFNAARKALEYVKDGMIIGLGSGSTVEIFIKELGKKIREEGMKIFGVPSSYQSYILALENGINVVDFLQYSELELCVDGADQVDKNLNCIKGRGAALLREKIIASASKKVVIIVDSTKYSESLNIDVPVEILPFSWGFVKREIEKIGGIAKLRQGTGKVGPVITDNGNFIADCYFGKIEDAEDLEVKLNRIPGVVENGIFPRRIIDVVIVGEEKEAQEITK